ncbi:MAG: hypothetical protein ACI87N_000500 [Flavobacteriales bacterium]|jgi:hypothetical protein
MKVFVNKIYYLFILLFGVTAVLAGTAPASGPPAPTGKGAGLPPPPGLPIDDYIYILILVALVFGCYIIQKRSVKTKPSI